MSISTASLILQVGDGKSLAPTQRAFNRAGVQELRKHKDDNIILPQATSHKQRTFLIFKQDRDQISSLLHKQISIAEFLLYKGKSDNFQFVHDIVQKFKDEETIPDCYINFIAEVAKNTPVCGYIQPTERKVLSILRKFCLRELNLRDGSHQSELFKLRSEIPALWNNVLLIIQYEKSTFLPKIVSNLILKLLKIRNQTFSTAETRYKEDYFAYEEETDDQCSFYPNFPLERHPKLYSVASNVDKDACEKTFSTHTAFADGIFSIGDCQLFFCSDRSLRSYNVCLCGKSLSKALNLHLSCSDQSLRPWDPKILFLLILFITYFTGCSCELSITYGFEAMMFAESPRHFFNFLTCREVDFNSLKGVIFDFACGLQR